MQRIPKLLAKTATQRNNPRTPRNLGLPCSPFPAQNSTLCRDGVWDLAPFWGYLQWLASQRDRQKSEFSSSRYWNRSAHFIGLVGEFVFSLESGLPLDADLKINGDGGIDFPGGIQVKTSTNLQDPTLKEMLEPKGGWSAYYALVKIDVERKWARYMGWCLGATLRNGPIENYGPGQRRTLPFDQLLSGLPPCIPPAATQEYRGWF
jgi:hypothetical protein